MGQRKRLFGYYTKVPSEKTRRVQASKEVVTAGSDEPKIFF